MKRKQIGKTWKLNRGLLYAGLNGAMAALVGPDDALVFDDNDNAEIKAKFYSAILGGKFEKELCAS